MTYKSKTNYVAEGCMQFVKAMINDHHADPAAVYQRLASLCAATANQLEAIDPQRNK